MSFFVVTHQVEPNVCCYYLVLFILHNAHVEHIRHFRIHFFFSPRVTPRDYKSEYHLKLSEAADRRDEHYEEAY